MWRSSFAEDWERRKEYLIRSLFQDVALLSPVPEEDESFTSSRLSNYRPATFTREQPCRPPSPLPPLIIEREPNRHDDPEEYYIKLARKMRIIYRKLFIEGKSDVSSSKISDAEDLEYFGGSPLERRKSFGKINDLDSENHSHNYELDEISVTINLNENSGRKRTNSENNTNTSEASSSKKPKSVDESYANKSSTEVSPKSTSDEKDAAQSDTLSSSPPVTGTRNKDKVETEESDDVSSETSLNDYSMYHKQVTFKADVHRDATDVFEVTSTIVKKAIGRDFEDENLAVLENKGVSDSIHPIIRQTEIMRTPQIHHSVGSLHDEDHSSSLEDIAMEEKPRPLEPHIESNFSADDWESVSTHVDVNFDLLYRISTPIEKGVENGNTIRGNDSEHSGRRKRSSSSSTSCTNRTIYEDAGVQTSLDYKREYRGVLRDIFVGKPKVFRLCSCVNHTCG